MAGILYEMYWVAGFLDGEGSFSLSGGKPARTPRLQATQVELFPLEKLHRLFGGGTIRVQRPNPLSRHTCHTWVLTGPRAAAIMMTIYPLMSPRRQGQIRRVLAIWEATPASFGEGYHSSVLNDHDALAAMQRVHNGEGVVEVARSVGIHHVVLSLWMRGKNKGYLRQRLQGDGQYKARRRSASPTDAEALTAMRRVRLGEPVTVVAKELGIHYSAISMWLTGYHRPYLLARLNEEGDGEQEV